MMKTLLTKDEIEDVRRLLCRAYPQAECALAFRTPYELLVATMLSAQCTDVRVNIVTAELFKRYNTPEAMVTLGNKELEEYIHSCGFFRSKADNILRTSRLLIDKYNSEVPADKKLLQELPGVGRKTANVVCAVAYGIPGIAVDTHVFRVANRIGLADAKDELGTELRLMEIFDESCWIQMHHVLIAHGRNRCAAKHPDCQNCEIHNICLCKGIDK